ASTTGSGFLCVQDNPCRLSIAVGAANTGDTIYVKGGTYTALGPAVITVTRSITLFGGWDGQPGGPNIRPYRNPQLYPTIIDGQNSRRAVYITGTIQPTLEGFIFTHGNATGLFAGCSASDAYGCGGGMFIYHARARIRNNTFANNTAMLTAPDFHFVGYGGGLYVEVGNGVIISHNVFMSNTAAAVYSGSGGGLAFEAAANESPNIDNNTFAGNIAPTWGGGIAIKHTYPIGISHNVIENNSAVHGAGLYTWYSTGLYIDANIIRGNSGGEGVYQGYTDGYFVNNVVEDNVTDVGLSLFNGGPQSGAVDNNIIAHNGETAIAASASSAAPLTVRLYHNTLVGSGSGTALLMVSAPATLTLVNTIVSGFDVGFASNVPTQTVAFADYTLFDTDVGSYGVGALTHIFAGAAAFIDPSARNYHIQAQSAARDVAKVTVISSDIDGDLRTAYGPPDIGADETPFIYPLFLPLARR
ncbi:MAG: right-handed parallel beta-helix repeat-containing protein, partial [Anaerolineales bacterium]